ncbi:VOC family protein [Pseudorhodobacter ferrugineus]|uniref:VOC family protein n=1 Tax=Pseudorhodobacter ferrugineus TaxID=77008 RepID=UPI0009DC203A|nr:VOC family protein [Pseudorhodobacter ferrugineus]
MLIALHHVQLAMPAGAEAQAIAFYTDVLGMTQVQKPQALAGRGGVWFEAGSIRLHLGVETPFTAARKAHPAFQVKNLDAVTEQLKSAGLETKTDQDLPSIRRIYIHDPFGNRIELLELMSGG